MFVIVYKNKTEMISYLKEHKYFNRVLKKFSRTHKVDDVVIKTYYSEEAKNILTKGKGKFYYAVLCRKDKYGRLHDICFATYRIMDKDKVFIGLNELRTEHTINIGSLDNRLKNCPWANTTDMWCDNMHESIHEYLRKVTRKELIVCRTVQRNKDFTTRLNYILYM
jgi:hypothetical protein